MTLQEKCMQRIISKFSDIQLRNVLHNMNDHQHLVVDDFVLQKHHHRINPHVPKCANCDILFFYVYCDLSLICFERGCFNRYCSKKCAKQHTSTISILCDTCGGGAKQKLNRRCKECIKNGVKCTICNRHIM